VTFTDLSLKFKKVRQGSSYIFFGIFTAYLFSVFLILRCIVDVVVDIDGQLQASKQACRLIIIIIIIIIVVVVVTAFV